MPAIDSFVGAFQGGARPNLFKVIVSSGYLSDGAEALQFLCKGASLPGRNIEQIEVPYLNRKIPYAGDPTNTDFTMTIINDTNFTIRKGFEAWQAAIQNRGIVTGIPIPQLYFSNVEVQQLDRDEKVLKVYTLYNAWPTAVQEIALSFDTNNAVEDYTVTLRYSHFDVA